MSEKYRMEILKDTVAGGKRVRAGDVVMVGKDDAVVLKNMGRARYVDGGSVAADNAGNEGEPSKGADDGSGGGDGGDGDPGPADGKKAGGAKG